MNQIITLRAKLVCRNPYVTDGLVAMWDGEWNGPGFRHRPTSALLYERVSGTYESNVASEFTCGTNYLEVAKQSYLPRPSALTTAFSRAVANGYGRLELIAYVNAPASQIYGNAFLMLDGTFGYNPHTGAAGISLLTGSWQVVNDKTAIGASTAFLCIEVNTQEGKMTYQLNDTYKSAAFTPAAKYSNTFYVTFNGTRIYCARLYDRPLTAEEISQNRQADQVRFNL